MSVQPLILGYWKIRGLAQPVRMAARYAGVEYTDEFFEQGDAPEYSRDVWLNAKKENKHGLDFPNLPYLVDPNNGVKITQSGAMMRYVARKGKLYGKDEVEMAKVDMLADTLVDFRGMLVGTCYGPADQFESKLGAFAKALPERLGSFSSYLGDKPFFAGNDVTYCDFMFYEMILESSKMVKGCLDQFKNLSEFCARIESLPAIQKFMAEKDYELPFNNKIANFK